MHVEIGATSHTSRAANTDADVGVPQSSTVTKETTVTTPWSIARQAMLPASKTNIITNKIAYFVVDEMRPFSTIENKRFRLKITKNNKTINVNNR